MILNVWELALEVTRRCNLCCPGYCMRGESQNVDLTPKIIDDIFNHNDFKLGYIKGICFSGGEPTLNPSIILYTINKIIENDINVREVQMVTNGQIYSPEITTAFNKFNEYRNAKVKQSIIKKWSDTGFLEKMLKDNTDGHARITFSNDQFHHPIPQSVKDSYAQNLKGVKITETGEKKEEDIVKTGFANIGSKKFTNELTTLRCLPEGDDKYLIFDTVYVTANGNYTTLGDNSYVDMDINNCGSVKEISLMDLFNNYGSIKCDNSQKNK